jgi:L-Ala-D/L-Glu epimerase
MKIARVDVEACRMPKQDPTWRFALAAKPVSEGWLVHLITDDGRQGSGYASSVAHMGASHAGLGGTLGDLGQAILGMDPFDIAAIHAALDHRLRGNHQAKAGIDAACYDLMANCLGVPLYRLLGGKCRDEVPLLRIVAIKTPDEMAESARQLVEEGYRYLKIKVEGHVRDDVARVAAIRKRVGREVHLTIDANQAYTPKAAIQAIRAMEEYGIDLAEQPVSATDLQGLELVTRAAAVPVEADESAGSVDEIFTLVANRIVDRVSLKVPMLGGVYHTLQAAAICEAGQVAYRMGAAVGSRLLAAVALHLAIALPGVDYACELGEYERLLQDPYAGLPVVRGSLRAPDAPGLGVERATRVRPPAEAPASAPVG